MLSKDEIVAAIAARKAEVETVHVPEWGGDIYLRRMTAGDMEAAGLLGGDQPADMPLRVLALCIADETGSPLFGVEELRDIEQADAVLVLRLFAKCAAMNGMMTSELEGMVGDFDAAPHDGSSTA
jgi:hypothetical protein